jgi:hypothetical protein
MPSHKTLKSVVASLAQSFTSLMNYDVDDYVLGCIVSTAWETGATGFRVDLLSGKTDGAPELLPHARGTASKYGPWLRDMVRSSGSSMEFVAEAELDVSVDPARRRPSEHAGRFESPYSCTVRILDDRGRTYRHEIQGWWYPEKPPPALRKPWWVLW